MLALRVDAHANEVKEAKERLIAQAGVLSEKADRNSIRTVRELQQQWTALGEGLRGVDQKQWREFRAACDRVFAGLDAERKERDAQTAALAGRAQAIVDEIEALLGDQDMIENVVPVIQNSQNTPKIEKMNVVRIAAG